MKNNYLSKICLSALALTLLFTSGCGGGTTGTGDLGDSRSVVVKGLTLDVNAQPVIKAQIIAAQTGDEVETDYAGRFTLQTNLSGTKLELIVRGSGFDRMVTIDDLPLNATSVEVSLAVDSQNDQVVVVAVAINEITPTPIPSVAPTIRPSEPTPKPTVVPTAVARIRGRISDDLGEAISGATIRLIGREETTSSSQSGNFSLIVPKPEGILKLFVEFKGSRVVVPITLPKNRNVDISLALKVLRKQEVGTANVTTNIEVVGIEIKGRRRLG